MLNSNRFSMLVVSACAASSFVLAASSGGVNESQVFATPRGQAQNVRFELLSGAIVQVDYDLVSTDEGALFSVTLEASQDGGDTFTMRPQTVSGDVGPKVMPGTGKRIVWDSGKDVERLQIDRFRFRIVATAGPLKAGVADPPRSATGSVAIRTEPAGAQVTVDGVRRGVTPLELNDIAPGAHRVTVQKAGFLENSRTVTVVPSTTEIVTVILTATSPQQGTSRQRSGGSRAKWLIPLAAAGGLAAVLGARIGNGASPSGTPSTTTTATPCSFAVSPSQFTVAASANTPLRISVSTMPTCSWTVSSNSNFVSVVDRTSFIGSDTAVISIEPNLIPGNRLGTLTVAGQVVTVTQVPPGPDTLALVGLDPPAGSTLSAGLTPSSGGAMATVSYFLGSRDQARLCISLSFAQGQVPPGQSTNNFPATISRGSGTVTVRFGMQATAPTLPITSTGFGIYMGEASNCDPPFLSRIEVAPLMWTRP